MAVQCCWKTLIDARPEEPQPPVNGAMPRLTGGLHAAKSFLSPCRQAFAMIDGVPM